MLQILRPDGSLTAEAPVDLDRARQLFAGLIAGRAYDGKAEALQKQGRLATYASFRGQEAAQIGSAAALARDDWMVASYRDAAAMWLHGYPWVNLILGRSGDERGGAAPEEIRVLPPSITVGAHMLHAVGIAWAEQLRGTTSCAITYFGDGATSEGDFHEAMNLAAVFEAPVVFLCQNNGWAISMPVGRQTASETIAQKAEAYGMPGVRVDGNDVFAVFAATGAALARARSGEGPTLIEAVTYRMNPHTTADDPARYRSSDEVSRWEELDPIERLRRYLQHQGAWTEEWEHEVRERTAAAVEAAVVEAEGTEPFTAGEVFEAMFEAPTTQLRDQRDVLQRQGGGGD
jgi:pyruvate dehydrogenase E1 component alpha subunit